MPSPEWRAVVRGWDQDTRIEWMERCAIMEYDGRLPRAQAEEEAFACL